MGKIIKGGNKIEKIDLQSKIYPEELRRIKKPPKALYAIGNIDLLNTKSISIIGSRACSLSGMEIAKQFASDLAHQGLTIISGMAVGIDTAAHIGALEVKGKTIAVLGCGFNNIFPAENVKLYNEIIENNGLVISEYMPNTKPSSNNFLNRNRIISALSIGILVVEAAYRSGTSVTCKYAKEQNKKVFCIPHNLNDKHGVGTNKLIKNGASLVMSAKDIIDAYSYLKNKKTGKENNKEKEIKIQIEPKYIEVYNSLIGPPQNLNQICNKVNMPVNEISNALLMLELDGVITKTAHGYQANM